MKIIKTCKVNANRKTAKQIYSKLEHVPGFSKKNFGISSSLTGKGVKVCIIDTGEPSHKDISCVGESVDMSDAKKSALDIHGHSTMISGIIGADGKSGLRGLAPEVELLYAKVSGDDNKCSFNCVVAGILWAVIKEADVILISLSSMSNFNLLHDAIKKAYASGICVIASAGKDPDVPEYPASYPEVMSVSRRNSSKRAKKFISNGGTVEMVLPGTDVYTTYLDNKYTKASGSSLAAATAAGLAALLIQREREKNSSTTPRNIYSILSALSYTP